VFRSYAVLWLYGIMCSSSKQHSSGAPYACQAMVNRDIGPRSSGLKTHIFCAAGEDVGDLACMGVLNAAILRSPVASAHSIRGRRCHLQRRAR